MGLFRFQISAHRQLSQQLTPRPIQVALELLWLTPVLPSLLSVVVEGEHNLFFWATANLSRMAMLPWVPVLVVRVAISDSVRFTMFLSRLTMQGTSLMSRPV